MVYKSMRFLIPALCFLLARSPVFACLEGYTRVTHVVTGRVAVGHTFKQDISPAFYFAAGKKVVQTPDPHIYLWLTPQSRGAWALRIGPKEEMSPDYIAVTALPFPPPLVLSAANLTRGVEFCFTMEKKDYEVAVKEVMGSGKSGIVEILSAQCKANDEGIGHGIITTTKSGLPRGELDFEADLEIPVHTTDCPKR